jgi:hypothetical protein
MNWGENNKQRARMDTTIQMYRKYFESSLPKNQQYWTMAGNCSTKDYKPLEGSEPWQILHEGLIKPEQFRGVEINPESYQMNKKAWPNLKWYPIDFYRALLNELSFQPGIVNMDSFFTPEKGCDYLGQIMYLLTYRNISHCLLFANLIVKGRYYKEVTLEYVIDKLQENINFQSAWDSGEWLFHPEVYRYPGWGKRSKTRMATFIFVKK